MRTRCFAEQFFLETWTIFPRAPCIFAVFSAVGALRQVIFWALDDEEFFAVEGSGGGGVAGSQTPRCHQLVSVTDCIADVM